MGLREKIAELFAVAKRSGAQDKPGEPEQFADLVLAIPEIKDALKAHERLVGRPHA